MESASSVNWYCAFDWRPPTRMSCTACRKVRAPATSPSGARSCWITSSADSLRSLFGFSDTNMKPELVWRPPVKPTTLSTAGFLPTMSIICANLPFIAWNDVL